MPLTPFQRDVLRLLASQRRPDSHVAGGTAINRSDTSPRYSADVDFFHDLAESVFVSAEADAAVLARDGYEVEWAQRQPFLQSATVSRGQGRLKLEWCYDSAFRFFPVLPDPEFGYCLHPADLATNKVLALAGRSQIRDLIDILFLHETYLTLGALVWAACGKDLGFTPISLLEHTKRNTKHRQEDLAGEQLSRPLTLPELKEAWLKAVAQAESLFAVLPPTQVGCLYLTREFAPVTPNPTSAEFSSLIRHAGSIGGAWPVVK